MENNNSTVTIPLEIFRQMEELIDNQNKRIDELANAHSVFIDRREPTGEVYDFGRKKNHTWYDFNTFQIKGSLVETNEAIKALRDELNELYERGNKREEEYKKLVADLKSTVDERDRALKRLNKGSLEQIAEKLDKKPWWR